MDGVRFDMRRARRDRHRHHDSMPHSIAQARFADRLILFAEFNSFYGAGYYCTRLHPCRADVYRHWKGLNEATCTCGRDEPVSLATNAGHTLWGDGHSVDGRACRHCLAITFDPLPDPDFAREKLEHGLPWWWLKS
jgi:hypothetical protein